MIKGKALLGLPRKILEVSNAFAAYEAMPDWEPASVGALGSHWLLMRGLCDYANHPGHVLETVFEFVIWINL